VWKDTQNGICGESDNARTEGCVGKTGDAKRGRSTERKKSGRAKCMVEKEARLGKACSGYRLLKPENGNTSGPSVSGSNVRSSKKIKKHYWRAIGGEEASRSGKKNN